MPEGYEFIAPPAPPGYVSIKALPGIKIVGDGVTDDAAQINAALAYAAAHNNLPLWAPPTFASNGNLTSYLLNSVGMLYAAGQVLHGAGQGLTVFDVQGRDGLAPINNNAYSSRWNFRGFTLRGDKSTARFTAGMKLGPGQTHWMNDLRIVDFCRGIDFDAQPHGAGGASGLGNIQASDIIVDMPAYPSQFLINGQPDFGVYVHSTGGAGNPQGIYMDRPFISGNRLVNDTGFLFSDGTSGFNPASLGPLQAPLWQASGIQVFFYTLNGPAIQLTQVNSNGSNPLHYTLWDADSTPVLIPVGATNCNCNNIQVRFDVTPPDGQIHRVLWNDPTIRAAIRIEVGNENTFRDCDISGAYIGFDCDSGPNECTIAAIQTSGPSRRFGPAVASAGRPTIGILLYGSPVETPGARFAYGAAGILSASGGSGHANGDILTIATGSGTLDLPSDEPVLLVVQNVDGGGAFADLPTEQAGVYVLRPGHFSTPPSNPITIASSTGAGTGGTINIDWETAVSFAGTPPRIIAGGAGAAPTRTPLTTSSPSTTSITPVALSNAIALRGQEPTVRRVLAQGNVSLTTGQGGAVGISVSYDGDVTTQYLPDWVTFSGGAHAQFPFAIESIEDTVLQPFGGSPWQANYRLVATAAVTLGSATLVSPGTGMVPGDVHHLSVGFLSSGVPAARTFPGANPLAGRWPGGLSADLVNTHQPQITISSTQAVSATVVNGGTGGTPGAVTLTGTTGTGTKFTLSGTINGSGILAGPLTVVGGGTYTVNPSNLAAEPVTGGSLTGATIAIAMGIRAFTINQAGVIAQAPPANPVGSSAITGVGSGATFNATWSASGETIQLMPGARIGVEEMQWPNV